jgi:hypothetical protein
VYLAPAEAISGKTGDVFGGRVMASREDFLAQIWAEAINEPLSGQWIDDAIATSERRPDDPFADTGRVLERLLAAGADARDLSLLARAARYAAAHRVLYMVGDPGVGGDELTMMHEELLGADPSGREGRPGSASFTDPSSN